MSINPEEVKPRTPDLWWEVVKSMRCENPKVQGNIKPNVRRAPVPGGWLLEMENTTYIFVPDAEHKWEVPRPQ